MPGSAQPPVIYFNVANEPGDEVLDEGQRETPADPWPQAWRLEAFNRAWTKQVLCWRSDCAWKIKALQGVLIAKLVIAIERPRELP
jgi:hypothetical protein